jgi:hypothetical protein
MIKSCSGIVAALAFLVCCSQVEADNGGAFAGKLMADRPGGQVPEWFLNDDLPKGGEIVSFNQAGDGDGAFEICQSQDGAVGTIAATTQGGAVCDTKDGAKDSFYVFGVPGQDDQEEVEEDEGEGGGLALKLQKKVRDTIYSDGLGSGFGGPHGGGLLPDFDWTDEEVEEIREALEDTDAWTRFLDQTEEDGRHGGDGTSAK